MALPRAMSKVKVNKTHGPVRFSSVKMASRLATIVAHAWVKMTSLRLSTMSAKAPAGKASRNIGNEPAAEIRAFICSLLVSEVISHEAPTSCIHVPIFEAKLASHSARNNGERRGAQNGVCRRENEALAG